MLACQTDYLPADLQAAPARANVKVIVELAILCGCDDVVTSPGSFPTLSGHGMQLTFRPHPYLGDTATFDRNLAEAEL